MWLETLNPALEISNTGLKKLLLIDCDKQILSQDVVMNCDQSESEDAGPRRPLRSAGFEVLEEE